MLVVGQVMSWVSVAVAALTCQRMSASSKTSARQAASVDIEASVQKTETWHLNKKFTVGQEYFIYKFYVG